MYSTMRHQTQKSQSKCDESLMKTSLCGIVLTSISLLCVFVNNSGDLLPRRRLMVNDMTVIKDVVSTTHRRDSELCISKPLSNGLGQILEEPRRVVSRNSCKPWEWTQAEPILEGFTKGKLQTDVIKIITELRKKKLNEISDPTLKKINEKIEALQYSAVPAELKRYNHFSPEKIQEVNEDALENLSNWFKLFCDVVAFRRCFSASDGKESKWGRLYSAVKHTVMTKSDAKKAFEKYFPEKHYRTFGFADTFKRIHFKGPLRMTKINALDLMERVSRGNSPYLCAWVEYTLEKLLNNDCHQYDDGSNRFSENVHQTFTNPSSIVEFYRKFDRLLVAKMLQCIIVNIPAQQRLEDGWRADSDDEEELTKALQRIAGREYDRLSPIAWSKYHNYVLQQKTAVQADQELVQKMFDCIRLRKKQTLSFRGVSGAEERLNASINESLQKIAGKEFARLCPLSWKKYNTFVQQQNNDVDGENF